MPKRIHVRAAVLGLGLAAAACDHDPAVEADPGFRDGLDGLEDPIARWLRQNMASDGTIAVGYVQMLEGIATMQGCDRSSIDSYVISDLLLTEGEEAFPRVINTVCSTDRSKADLAFFALAFAEAGGIDLDEQRVEMFAWDDTDNAYHFYATEAVEGGRLKVEIQPERCQECHLTPSSVDPDFMPMTPIMNELAAPWEHWHAEPVSVNHVVPTATAQAPLFKALAGPGSPFLKSAARLEQTIRSAFSQRVAAARVRARRDKPADVGQAMGMLRPLFCDEQLTYVSEDGSSGLLASGAVIDDGFHSVFFQIRGTGWPWEWWNDRAIRFAERGASNMVGMMPVRGASVVAYEKQMLAIRGLTPEQVLQVRTLDWHTPALSDFRCNLWKNALPRVQADPPEITPETRNLAIFAPLLDAILTVHPSDFGLTGDPVRISAGTPGSVVVLGRADEANVRTLVQALTSGSIGMTRCEPDGAGTCVATIEQVGEMVEQRFKAAEAGGRDAIRRDRDARGRRASQDYANAPCMPGINCD